MSPSSSGSVSETPGPEPSYADVAPEALIQVGFVFRPHGIEGELKVDPEQTDDPTRFEELGRVYLGAHSHRVSEHDIVSVRYQETKRGTTVILGVEGIESRTDAEEVTKLKVFAFEDDLELQEGEIFVHDLVGMDVVTESGDVIGRVVNYQEMPAQDIFVVHTENGEERMIPAVEDFVIDIDVDEQQVIVRPIEGLL